MAIFGTNADEVLKGTLGNDLIYGLEGADYILADGNNNTPYGGKDTVFGGVGNDIVYAYVGNDEIYGDEGNDQLFAGSGNDTVVGGLGNDRLNGEVGNDVLLADAGNDLLVGGFDSDFLSGGLGNDTIESHSGLVSDFVVEIDIMHGGAGADIFRLRTDYLGSTGSRNPFVDASHARIEDFVIGEDILDLKYASGYEITYFNHLGGANLDTRIAYQGDLVAIVQDVQLSSANLS